MNLLEDMIGSFEIEKGKKGRVIYLDVDEVEMNEKNVFQTNDIELLAKNIKEEGILQPLILWKDNDDRNILHTGHRRFLALKYLVSNHEKYSYFGKDVTGTVPAIFLERNDKDDIEMQISMIRSNSYRHLTDEEKNNLIDITEDYVKSLETKGQKPQGRTREIISEITGVTLNYVQNYLSKKNKAAVSVVAEDDVNEEIFEGEKKQDDTIRKFIKKLDKLTAEVYELEFENVSLDDHDRISDAINDLKGCLDNLIY